MRAFWDWLFRGPKPRAVVTYDSPAGPAPDNILLNPSFESSPAPHRAIREYDPYEGKYPSDDWFDSGYMDLR